jgi:hypothetical protein
MKIATQKKPINKRAFISIAMFVSLMGLPVSGIMNHQLQFEPLTPARHFWMSVHDVSAILFVALAIIHICYNWRVLLHYVQKAKETVISKEAIMAALLVVIIVGVISSHVLHVNN